MSDTEVIEAYELPAYNTTQQAQQIAFAHAFQLAKGQSLNIHTYSKHAFDTLLSHAAIWKKCGLLTIK